MNPTTLQGMSLLAGIAGSEKLDEKIKEKASKSLSKLLDLIELDIKDMQKGYSTLINL